MEDAAGGGGIPRRITSKSGRVSAYTATAASSRKDRKKISTESSLMSPPHFFPDDTIGRGTEIEAYDVM